MFRIAGSEAIGRGARLRNGIALQGDVPADSHDGPLASIVTAAIAAEQPAEPINWGMTSY
jgi:hypothetical protein